MFQVKYHMDGKRYRAWTCPPTHKLPGFWFWMVLLVISTPAMFYLRSIDAAPRHQSLAAMTMLVAVYRGILFRHMHTDKQFRVMCMDYNKPQTGWDSRVDLDEDGISNYMDEELLNHVDWDRVHSMVQTTSYVDLGVGEDYIRLPRAEFSKGTAEEFIAWMDENHPEIQRKEEIKQFAN